MIGTVADLIAFLKTKLQQADLEPAYREALEAALKILETDGASLANVGKDALVALFDAWLGEADLEDRKAVIGAMDASMLILDMAAGAATLETDTQKREAQREAVLLVLERLGDIGIKLLLRLL